VVGNLEHFNVYETILQPLSEDCCRNSVDWMLAVSISRHMHTCDYSIRDICNFELETTKNDL